LQYRFNDYVLDSSVRELRRGTELIAVEPQVFDLLSFLIRHRDRVVSKDDLMAAIWNRRIVSESALTSRINSARAALGDSGKEQRLIKTLRGNGFRFVGMVAEVERLSRATSASPTRPLPLPEKPSIAVLPFNNMSNADDVYFSDGIAEDIITELSRYSDLFVIARNSSFIYRGKAARITDVARELGVHCVLEGSVRRAGQRVRINALLIDAATGDHIWAQRYDRSLDDLFSVQDDVTQSVVAVLPGRIQTAALEHASRKTRSSLAAYDHLLRGKYCHHLETPEANREAEIHFNRAIELDPRFAAAYAWKACTIGQALRNEFQQRTPERVQQSIQIVERAMSIDENDTECHRIMCRIALMRGQFAKSEHHLDRALALNPNDPRLVAQRGINFTFLGDPQAAIPWIERAMRLDPFSAHRYYLDMVRALFMAERPEDAIVVLERTARAHWEHHVWLAACNAAAGKKRAAQQAGGEALALRRNLSIAKYINDGFAWTRDKDKVQLRNALAQAGLPL
jgi:TolB-like protein